jgi:hypothetical protein
MGDERSQWEQWQFTDREGLGTNFSGALKTVFSLQPIENALIRAGLFRSRPHGQNTWKYFKKMQKFVH